MQALKIRCFSCYSDEHMISDCPLIHYAPRKLNIIKKSLISENQEREKYNRKCMKYCVKTHLKEIQIKVLNLSRKQSLNESKTIPDSELSGEIDLSPLSSGLSKFNIKSFTPMIKQEKKLDGKEPHEIYEVNFCLLL